MLTPASYLFGITVDMKGSLPTSKNLLLAGSREPLHISAGNENEIT